jgi:glycosyltransferase involved in cell wall biosynthesis
MRIGLIHNEYAAFSGEEAMFRRIVQLLGSRGHEVLTFTKNSRNIGDSFLGKAKAFGSGLYSAQSRREIRSFIRRYRPDVIQIQNLYPLISPSILPVIRDCNVPVVMRCANYRLICPNGLLLRKGQICRRCTGGKEWWCLLTNCQRNLAKSFGYALRNYVSHTNQWYHRCVNMYYAQTQFQKTMLAQNGFDSDKIEVIGNMTTFTPTEYTSGGYVGYLGRISEEKGIRVLLNAARRLPHIPFKLAGAAGMEGFNPAALPENVEYKGFLANEQKASFIKNAAMIIVPSLCYEGFPGSILDAMSACKPVVCAAIGGLPEIVRHENTGLLFAPGDDRDLAARISVLWQHPILQELLGKAGRQWAEHNLSENRFYERLMAVYEKAMHSSVFLKKERKCNIFAKNEDFRAASQY